MSEAASRRLFLAELVVAAPAFALLASGALLGGGTALWYIGQILVSIIASGFRRSGGEAVALPVIAVAAICIAGLVGLVLFVWLSWRFWRNGRRGLHAERRLFGMGLLNGGPPLVFVLVAAMSSISRVGSDRLGVIALSAVLLILVPIAHLWLELRSQAAPSPTDG
ncbi:hypothetical protein [Enterovirga rhinocerotis]|uniref:Uncharacterized protein n=1 Tax=Enterovirga rhinocerotis TaxID=1339210 RepID=A0A4R7C471_9HYPH|nr:hypothetical protein [Enterovirga rhinocerotis]TDR93188.1 hypothetical protein EV668_0443 [Enterovirga rhinocerotis]